jgi:hypothetical protein
MQAVLFKIEQHQPAGKQEIEDETPSERGREQLRRIEQDQLVGLGAKQRDIQAAEYAAAVHWAVTLRAALDETLGIGQDCEGVANYGPAVVAGDMRQRFA